ncbi:acyltransferase family protein [Wenzhouxiangella sp. EGI_FJ10305]|uniref:acyltransferase family protein n=1 Tax=Wenzhouxiangella sp. EGI_FJ10305 TaxID=3243768 RepID=UPI0035D7CA38
MPALSQPETQHRDLYPDALRALALLIVVFGHWFATLPRMEGGELIAIDHMLHAWIPAAFLTWAVQVVPLFVFVSAAVSTDGAARRLHRGHSQLAWWGSRALRLARPTVTYLAALTLLMIIANFTGGRFLGTFDGSLTVHLWFLIMLLTVQALLPLSVEADRRFGLGAVIALILLAAAIDMLRAGAFWPTQWPTLGARVTGTDGGIGWLNTFFVWLLPQQLGIAWKRGRFQGAVTGLLLVILGTAWLVGTVMSGYPVGMIGNDLEGNSNMLPPTLALMGVMWLQVGLVLLCERPARWLLDRERLAGIVAFLGAFGMPLYLWHKLAELPAAWLGEKIGAPIDAGTPGDPGFWSGRLWWIGLCLLMVVPVLAIVAWIEMQRRRTVPHAESPPAIVIGGLALLLGLGCALVLGTMPGALIGLAGVVLASLLLRRHSQA